MALRSLPEILGSSGVLSAKIQRAPSPEAFDRSCSGCLDCTRLAHVRGDRDATSPRILLWVVSCGGSNSSSGGAVSSAAARGYPWLPQRVGKRDWAKPRRQVYLGRLPGV